MLLLQESGAKEAGDQSPEAMGFGPAETHQSGMSVEGSIVPMLTTGFLITAALKTSGC